MDLISQSTYHRAHPLQDRSLWMHKWKNVLLTFYLSLPLRCINRLVLGTLPVDTTLPTYPGHSPTCLASSVWYEPVTGGLSKSATRRIALPRVGSAWPGPARLEDQTPLLVFSSCSDIKPVMFSVAEHLQIVCTGVCWRGVCWRCILLCLCLKCFTEFWFAEQT